MLFNYNFIKGKLIQYIASITVNLLSFSTGVAVCWPSPVLSRLNDDNYSPFSGNVTSLESMWIGALISLGTAIGPFPSAYSADEFGRKFTLLAAAVPFLVGWVLTITAGTVAQLMAARIVLGLACSVSFTVVPTYVAEIADVDIRGALGAFLQVCITAGMLFAYCVGPFTSYICFSGICLTIPLLFLITFCWMPESPYFLISKGEIEKAKESLTMLRGKSQSEINEETQKIQIAVEEELMNRGTYFELLTSRAQRWPLFIGFGLAMFFPLSGVTAILTYSEPLFMKTANANLSPEVLTIIIGFVQLLACLVTPFIYDRIGRKVILILSAFGMAVPLAAFGIYFFIIEQNLMDQRSLDWMPITCVAVYICANVVGFGGMIWVVMSEIFPVNLREKAMAFCSMACFFTAFLVALTFDDLDRLIESSGTFWLYAGFCALSGIFVIFVLPETRGLTFQQIQQKLRRDTKCHQKD